VLSHDHSFLKLVWEKLDSAERKALQIDRTGGDDSSIDEFDLEHAAVSEFARDKAALTNFASSNIGDPADVIKRIRTTLETWCQHRHPEEFASETLGVIARSIEGAKATHPLGQIAVDLIEINEYSRDHHHGDSPYEARPAIDTTELKAYVVRTLSLLRGDFERTLQPA